jgi:hypothetical protein
MTGVLPPMRAVLGEAFPVFVLDDAAENVLVTAVHGPHAAR